MSSFRKRIFAAAVASALVPQPGTPEPTRAAGIRMTSYHGTLHVVRDHTIVHDIEIRGSVVIAADNVTMRNVRVISGTQNAAIKVEDGADGFILADSEVDGAGITLNAIDGHGTFLRNDIHGAENGINVTGPALIEGNSIHGLRNRNGSPHYDGIQVDGGHDVRIVGNTVINDNTQTAAIMLDNYFQGLSNITVEGNRLIGGGYTIYIDGRFGGGALVDSSIRIVNNRIGGGYYGDYAFYDHRPVLSGNTRLDVAEADIRIGRSQP